MLFNMSPLIKWCLPCLIMFIKLDKPLDILNHRSVNKSLRPTLMALYTSINNLHLTLDCLHTLIITLTVLHNIYVYTRLTLSNLPNQTKVYLSRILRLQIKQT